MIRNCSGDTPPQTPTVYHPKLPAAVLMAECPMRSLRHPAVLAYLPIYGRIQRYGALPRAGGLEAQDAQTMAACDVMAGSLQEAPPQAPEIPAPTPRKRRR